MIRAGSSQEQRSPSPKGMISAGGKGNILLPSVAPWASSSGSALEIVVPNLSALKGDLILFTVQFADGGAGDLFDVTYNGTGFVFHSFQVDFSNLSYMVLSLTVPANAVNANLVVNFGAAYDYNFLVNRVRNLPTPQYQAGASAQSATPVAALSSGNVSFGTGLLLHYGYIGTLGPPTDAIGTWGNSMVALTRIGRSVVTIMSLKDAYRVCNPGVAANASISGQTARLTIATALIFN